MFYRWKNMAAVSKNWTKGSNSRFLHTSPNLLGLASSFQLLKWSLLYGLQVCTMNQMESKLSDNSLLELSPLIGKHLTRWAIQAPWSLLFKFRFHFLFVFKKEKRRSQDLTCHPMEMACWIFLKLYTFFFLQLVEGLYTFLWNSHLSFSTSN